MFRIGGALQYGHMPALLELTDLSKRYDAPGAVDAPYVLKNLSLTVAAGTTVVIVGPSGSGKSTLLNIIGALDRPTSGSVRLGGQELNGIAEPALADLRNRFLGFVFQLHHLLPQCTVLENVLVPTLASSAVEDKRASLERARHLVARVGLTDRAAAWPGQLSGGERQRVAVARALINRPKLLLADEPTGSLDRATAERLTDLLLDINREEGTTLIVVTHATSLAERLQIHYQLTDGALSAAKSSS